MRGRSAEINGFGLIEVAIIILIISALVISIIAGQAYVHKVRALAVIGDINKYKSAIATFKEIYKYLPGDYPYAKIKWPETENGNGDNSINVDGEDLMAWEQLSLSELLPEKYNGTFAPKPEPLYKIGYNSPVSSLEGAGYWLYNYSIYGKNGNMIMLGTPDTYETLKGGALRSKYAQAIDEKIDDGKAASGEIMAEDGYFAKNCVNNTEPPEYTGDSEKISCVMVFFLNENEPIKEAN